MKELQFNKISEISGAVFGVERRFDLFGREIYNMNYNNFNKEYYPLIDIAKFFCALLVVVIHCLEIVEHHSFANFIVKCFSVQAVPFFMLVSGFFVADKLNKKMNVKEIGTFCVKNWLNLYMVWVLLWMPCIVRSYREKYQTTDVLHFIIILIRRIVFAGYGVYWYLLVLAESFFILAICIKFNHKKLLYGMALIGFFLGILYDTNVSIFGIGIINKIFYTLFSWSNNLFMKGVPYVTAGYLVKNHIEDIKNWGTKKPVLLYIFASIGMIIIYRAGWWKWLCLYPLQAFCLLVICCQNIKCPLNGTITRNCRNMSSAIYFLHTVFIYRVVDIIWGRNAGIVLKFSISVLLSVGVYYIAKRFKIKALKWLLSVK